MKTISLNRITIALSAIFLSTLIFISCQKENSTPPAPSDGLTDEQAATYSDESAQAEASFDDADNVAFIAADEEGNAGGFGFEGRSASGVAGRPYLPVFLNCVSVLAIVPPLLLHPTTVLILKQLPLILVTAV